MSREHRIDASAFEANQGREELPRGRQDGEPLLARRASATLALWRACADFRPYRLQLRLELVAGLQLLELVGGLDRIGFEDIPGTRGIPSLVHDLSVCAVAEAGDGRVSLPYSPKWGK
jgi:hypothetical protein